MAALSRVLGDAQRYGYLGQGAVADHVRHSLAFMVPDWPLGDVAELGSGGGVPGLVLARATDRSFSLVERGAARAAFLRRAVQVLGLGERVAVVEADAHDVGRDPAHRGRYGVVVARGFAAPAITAECAAPLLREGGRLLVSEPPGGAGVRWDPAVLAKLGLVFVEVVDGVAVLDQVRACPAPYPRRSQVAARRPLWRAD